VEKGGRYQWSGATRFYAFRGGGRLLMKTGKRRRSSEKKGGAEKSTERKLQQD